MTLKDKDANLLPHDPVNKLIKKVVHALGANMLAVKDVAATGKDECVQPMSEMALHKKSGIARDVLSRLADGNGDNTKLETICKLAHALNVPPAFLLMTSDDWRRLIRAINDMQNTVQTDSKLSEYVKASINADKATAGLKLARKLKMYPDNQEIPDDVDYQQSERIEQDLNRRNEIKRQSVLAMTAIAQNVEAAVSGNDSTKTKEEYLAILTTLAAIFGASVQAL
jgi:DNA-binding Xre family transcriptional regulator